MADCNWGGGIEMAALTQMRKVNVHFYEKCSEGYKRISAFEAPNARKTISVLYQGRMHYDALSVEAALRAGLPYESGPGVSLPL